MELSTSLSQSRCPHCYKIYKYEDRDGSLCCKNGHNWKIVSNLDDKRLVDELREDYKNFLEFHYSKIPWLKRKTNNKQKLFTSYLYDEKKNLFDLKSNINELIKKMVDKEKK